MFEPLIYSLYDCAKVIYNRLNRIPKYVEYVPNDKAYYTNSLFISIGESAKGTVYLNINQRSLIDISYEKLEL